MADTTNNQQNTLENSLPSSIGGQPEKLAQQTDSQVGQLDVKSFLDGVRTVMRGMSSQSDKVNSQTPETILAQINALVDQLPDTITPADVDTIASASMDPLTKGLRTLSTSRDMSILMDNKQLIQYSA